MKSTDRIAMFERTVQETYEWLDDIQREVEGGDTWPADAYDRPEALQALRGVLHALRDELGVDQNANLAAQFPTLIRGIYFESWNPPNEPIEHGTAEAFLSKIEDAFTGYEEDFDPEWIAPGVLAVLTRRMPEECAKIKKTLPKDLRDLWNRD